MGPAQHPHSTHAAAASRWTPQPLASGSARSATSQPRPSPAERHDKTRPGSMTATLRALSVVAGQQQTPAGPTSQAVAGDRPLRCPSTRGHGLCGLRTRVPHRGQRLVVNTYPEPETEKERSPIDFPQEWLTPTPSRRPDIFPEFEKQDTPLPKPMPGDPEQPEDEEEEDKKKKEEEGDEEDPDKEQPEEPAEE